MAAPLSLTEIQDNMALFPDWEGRYGYVLDLASQLPPMPDALKTEAARVRGCTSQVWLHVQKEGGRLNILVDSDAHIVRGLCAIFYAAYQGARPQDVPNIPLQQAFEAMGLSQHLSPNRRQGFAALQQALRQQLQEADPTL